MTKPRKKPEEVAAERFALIAPMATEGHDKCRLHDLMREISEREGISKRTLKRYIDAYDAAGFDGLKPKVGGTRTGGDPPTCSSEIVDAAIELRRESPGRSVRDIILILELEGLAAPGTVARSTLQRHLQDRGYGSTRMKMYAKKGAAARRFQKTHRCQLWQSDVKYGPYASPAPGMRKVQLYLVAWIDDATRFIVAARFYTSEATASIEDSLRHGVERYGAPDAIYVDNGAAYRSDWLAGACARIGTRRLKARPYHPEGKGKIERWNREASKFLSEAALAKLDTLAEYNEYLDIWISEYYHKNPHAGIDGASPAAAFGADSRSLRFVPEDRLREAFLHTEMRKVNKAGCISFEGKQYEASLALVGMGVEVRFDPSWTDEIEIVSGCLPPFKAKALCISEHCGVRREIPDEMKPAGTDRSRMFDALKKRKDESTRESETVTKFSSYWREGKNV
jgi:transposase InsO family protein